MPGTVRPVLARAVPAEPRLDNSRGLGWANKSRRGPSCSLCPRFERIEALSSGAKMPVKRGHWLLKSEPDVFSIDALKRDGKTHWEGVRNYQARNHLRAMKLNDWVLFYHSNAKPPGVAGVARVCREAYVDDAQFDPKSPYHDPASKREEPRWSRVDVEFVERFDELVSLDALKADTKLDGMLVRKQGMRLSVQPVESGHFKRVLSLGKSKLRD